jgi:hypothetical protein
LGAETGLMAEPILDVRLARSRVLLGGERRYDLKRFRENGFEARRYECCFLEVKGLCGNSCTI